MTKNITSFLTSIAFVITLFFISSAPSVFAPERSTGVASTNCTDCHSGGAAPGTFTISNLPATYVPGQPYSGQICLTDTDASVVAAGFSMYQSDFMSNVFTVTDATTKLTPGNSYLTHTSKKFFTNDQSCWDFTWDAPAVGSGTKTIAAAGNAVNNNSSTSGDHPAYSTSVDIAEGALPVDLANFAVSKNDKNTVLLYWETATEINNDYFQIERSYNLREFETIGKIEGAGNTSDIENYSFIDEKPELNRSVYYRLKQVDFDGAFEYSLIQKIIIEQSAISIEKVYPNPVFRSETVKVKFDLSTDVQEVEMVVYDIAGHEKIKNTFAVNQGENIINFSPNDFVAGQYFITLSSDNQRIMSEMFIVTE